MEAEKKKKASTAGEKDQIQRNEDVNESREL